MAKHPYAATRLAQFLTKRIDELRGSKSQVEIADQAGFTTPNMISMLKNGEGSARRAIAQPAPKSVNQLPAAVAVG